MSVALIIHDDRDRLRDEVRSLDSARDLFNTGHLMLDAERTKPGAPVYRHVEGPKHPQWHAWRDWYTANYTSYIPMYNGQPTNVDTLLSWKTWCEAHTRARSAWRKFSEVKPTCGPEQGNMVEILWRSSSAEVGIGWYMEEDADQWTGEWLPVSELQ